MSWPVIRIPGGAGSDGEGRRRQGAARRGQRRVRTRIAAGECVLDLGGPVGEELALRRAAPLEELAAEAIEVRTSAEVVKERGRPVREVAYLRPAQYGSGGPDGGGRRCRARSEIWRQATCGGRRLGLRTGAAVEWRLLGHGRPRRQRRVRSAAPRSARRGRGRQSARPWPRGRRRAGRGAYRDRVRGLARDICGQPRWRPPPRGAARARRRARARGDRRPAWKPCIRDVRRLRKRGVFRSRPDLER